MQPGPKRRAIGDRGQRAFHTGSAVRAADTQPTMTPHKRRYGRQVDLIVFADNIGHQIRAPLRANLRALINRRVRSIMQSAAVTLMTRLGYTRPGSISPRLFVRRGRLRRRARGLIRTLQPSLKRHVCLHQLFLAQTCQIITIYALMDSENFVFGKGVSNYVLRSNPQLPGRRFGIAKSVKKGQPVDYEPLQNGVFLYDRPTLTVKPIRFIGKVSTTCAVLTAVAPELTADC